MRLPPVVLAALALAAAPAAARAQLTGAPSSGFQGGAGLPASSIPRPLREIGFDQKLNERLPLDAPFVDDAGRRVTLGDYFHDKPVVLAFVYFDCPMLCTQILSSITSSLGVLSLDSGRDFELVMVSFDPRETPALAAEKKALYLERYGRPAAAGGWHFLTGGQASIDRATAAAGFRYAWDDETQQFAHPSGVIVATPDGRLSRYLFGIEYGARDLRLALVEASAGRIGSVVDAVMLYCYHYDPLTGRYGLVIRRVLRLAAAATVLLIGGFIAVMLRRERLAARLTSPPGSGRAH
jgi:protein SCO1/2